MKRVLLLAVMLLSLSPISAKKVGVYCFFENSGSQLYEDDVVKLVTACVNDAIVVAIENKTDNIIYIDKANTFVYINGTPISLFQNSVTTTSQSGTQGAAVNLGGVANALGIGGPLGSLLGATTIGGGSTTTSSTMIYEQRVLAVAPHAAETLYSAPISINQSVMYEGEAASFGHIRAGRNGLFIDPDGTQTKFRRGMSRHYDQNRTPFEIKVAATYSPDETFVIKKLVKVNHYICDVVIDHKACIIHPDLTPYCVPYSTKSLECYIFKTGRNVLAPIGAVVSATVMIAGSVALVVYAIANSDV